MSWRKNRSRASIPPTSYEVDDGDLTNFEAPNPVPITKKKRKSKAQRSTVIEINEDGSDTESLDHAGDNVSGPTDSLSSKHKEALHQWMCAFRKRWANWWNYLPIESVNCICKTPPTTIDALAAIPGIGAQKAQNIGDLVLATLYAFFERNELLHRYPELCKPKCEKCPTWENPLSDEAAHRRLVLVSTNNSEFIEANAENRLNASSSNSNHSALQKSNPVIQSPPMQSQSQNPYGFTTSTLGFRSHSRASAASVPPVHDLSDQRSQRIPGTFDQQVFDFVDGEISVGANLTESNLPRATLTSKRPNPYVTTADQQLKRPPNLTSSFFYSLEG